MKAVNIGTVITVELIIAIIAFLVAPDKTRFGEVSFVFTFISLIIAVVYILYARARNSGIH
jgi:amino acid permease